MAELKRNIGSSTLDTTYISTRNIKTLENNLVAAELGTPGEIAMNSGSTIRWHIDTNLTGATATNSLTNDAGTPIAWSTRDSFNEDTPAYTGVEAQLQVYGTFIPVRNQDLDQMPRGMMDRISSRISYRARKTIDTLCIAALDGSGTGYGPSTGAGTTTTRKAGAGALSSGDVLTAEEILLATGDLHANDAEPFDNGKYMALVHSVAATSMKTDVSTSRVTWFETNKHVGGFSGQEKILSGTEGDIGGTTVVRTNSINTSTQDTTAAYDNLVIARDAFGIAAQGDIDHRVFINRPSANSTDQPHRMYATIAWQVRFFPKLLDSNRVVLLYTAQS